MFEAPGRDQRWSILIAMALLIGLAGLTACGNGDADEDLAVAQNTPEASDSSPEPSLERIDIGISMYLLVDDLDDPNPVLSSKRTEEGLVAILDRMNNIWGQANIRLELATLETLAVNREVLKEVGAGNINAFFDRLGVTIPFTETGLISGFYTLRVGGPNGITPLGSRWYMVIDEPSVHDERVSSHEIGHILGLRHVLNDPNRLLYSGTNGMKLSSAEITQARDAATRMLEARR